MDSTKIGHYIKEQLKIKKITQDGLAEQLSISSSAVSQALSGKNLFDISNLQRLSQILDIPLDTIINAGEERETNLELLSKLPLAELITKDPLKEYLQSIDSKGNNFFFYLLKHENIEVIKEYKEESIKNYRNKLAYTTLLVKNNQAEMLSQASMPDELHQYLYLSPKEDYKEYNDAFNKITEEQFAFFDAYVLVGDTKIYDLINMFKNYTKSSSFISESIDPYQIPWIVYYAIRTNKIPALVQFETIIDKNTTKIDYRKQVLHESLLKLAFEFQSWDVINHYLKKMDSFSFFRYFDSIFKAGSLDFIYRVKKELSPIEFEKKNRYELKPVFNNYKTLSRLVEKNQFELVEEAVRYSDQDSLDKALSIANGNQIEVMKAIILSGGRYTHTCTYSGNHYVFDNMTGMMRYLITELETKKN